MSPIFSKHYSHGFTLIELLIATAIVGILATISLPSYQSSIAAGRRGEAKAELLRLAHEQAKWRINHTTYADDLNALGGVSSSVDYTLAIVSHTASEFSITATPTSTNGQNTDSCGTLTIDQTTTITSSSCLKP